MPSRDAYVRVANSVAFWNAARSVVLVTEDPERPDEMRFVTQRKANWSRRRPVERHRLEGVALNDTLDPESGRPIETSRMVFVEVADDVVADDVLGLHSGAEKTTHAEDVLRVLLEDGDWHDSAGLKKLAGAIGVAERTLKLAAQELGVEYDRRGFPASTWWRLTAVGQGYPSPVCPTADLAQPSHSPSTNGAVGQTHLGEAELVELGTARLDDLRRREERGGF